MTDEAQPSAEAPAADIGGKGERRLCRDGKVRAYGFKKGVSGNPSGRAKFNGDRAAARNYARGYTKEAIDKLVKKMRSGKTDEVQLRAAAEILDRAWGRPRIDMDPAEADPHAAFAAFLAGLAARRAARLGEVPGVVRPGDDAGDGAGALAIPGPPEDRVN